MTQPTDKEIKNRADETGSVTAGPKAERTNSGTGEEFRNEDKASPVRAARHAINRAAAICWETSSAAFYGIAGVTFQER